MRCQSFTRSQYRTLYHSTLATRPHSAFCRLSGADAYQQAKSPYSESCAVLRQNTNLVENRQTNPTDCPISARRFCTTFTKFAETNIFPLLFCSLCGTVQTARAFGSANTQDPPEVKEAMEHETARPHRLPVVSQTRCLFERSCPHEKRLFRSSRPGP